MDPAKHALNMCCRISHIDVNIIFYLPPKNTFLTICQKE